MRFTAYFCKKKRSSTNTIRRNFLARSIVCCNYETRKSIAIVLWLSSIEPVHWSVSSCSPWLRSISPSISPLVTHFIPLKRPLRHRDPISDNKSRSILIRVAQRQIILLATHKLQFSTFLSLPSSSNDFSLSLDLFSFHAEDAQECRIWNFLTRYISNCHTKTDGRKESSSVTSCQVSIS